MRREQPSWKRRLKNEHHYHHNHQHHHHHYHHHLTLASSDVEASTIQRRLIAILLKLWKRDQLRLKAKNKDFYTSTKSSRVISSLQFIFVWVYV